MFTTDLLGSCRHDGTLIGGAELNQRAIDDTDFVIELDGVDGQPLIQVLAIGEFDSQ